MCHSLVLQKKMSGISYYEYIILLLIYILILLKQKEKICLFQVTSDF
jgi:hypothetical protein